MEKKLTIDLQDAIKWYNGSNKELRDLALKIFSKDELEPPQWQSIKTWKDVLKVLNVFTDMTDLLPTRACYAARVQMIREALNKGYNLKLWEGTIWYPYLKIGPKENVERYSNSIYGKVAVDESQPGSENRLLLVGSYAVYGGCAGLGFFDSYSGVGLSPPACGLLGCATKEIAEHFGKYFYFEILSSWFGDKIRKIEEND